MTRQNPIRIVGPLVAVVAGGLVFVQLAVWLLWLLGMAPSGTAEALMTGAAPGAGALIAAAVAGYLVRRTHPQAWAWRTILWVGLGLSTPIVGIFIRFP